MSSAAATSQQTGMTADLLCHTHRQSILATLTWPAGFEAGPCSPCADCRRTAASVASGMYLPFDSSEHDIHRLAAEHEAGHVVANLLHGNLIDVVDLGEPDLGGLVTGLARVEILFINPGSRAITTWAGTLAHRDGLRRRGLLHDDNAIGCASTARLDAQWLLANTTAKESATAMAAARDLVREHWEHIDHLAGVLLANGRMTGDEIAAVYPAA